MGIYRGTLYRRYDRNRDYVPIGHDERLTASEFILALIIGGIIGALFYIVLSVPIWHTGTALADPWVKDRMRYHGTSSAYEKHDGIVYFERDGKECRL